MTLLFATSGRVAAAWRLLAAAACLSLAIVAHAQGDDSALAKAPEPFGRNCAVCHGGDAQGTDRAPPLQNSRSLRGKSDTDIAAIVKNGRGNMPSFSFLPAEDLQALAHFIRTLNADAFDAKPPGDVAEGKSLFFGAERCSECHTALGAGGANGPDLSNIARQLTVSELARSLEHPGARVVAGYERVEVTLTDNSSLRGFARNRGSHGLVLQTDDGQLHMLLDREYEHIAPIKASAMPAFAGSPGQERDLIAFLSTLNGVAPGPASPQPDIPASATNRILEPRVGDWPTYAGNVDGNRHSLLKGISAQNVASLQVAWMQTLPYSPLETTPMVMDGIMYVSGPNQVWALDARTGSTIWNFTRPRSGAGGISGDAAKGATRGVALLGDRVFFITDDAHLICLHKLTGAVLWDVPMPEQPGRYGGTSAPLVAGDLVIGGVSGGDEDIRGFVAAYKATTGERVWRTWTIPKAGEPLSDTWKGDTNPQGGASWLTPSYDIATGVLYVATGNPYPDTDGDGRGGDNLYTDSDLALDAKTGKLLWHFQFTPHDLHDWDANQPIALVDASFHGKARKLLLHANRNGFLYVLDRGSGAFLQATPLVKRLTWASGVGADGRPIVLPNSVPTPAGVEVCPAVRGATNWYSTAYNPETRLYYVMTTEDCSVYRKAHDGGYGRADHPEEPAMKVLRAFDVNTGKVAWEIPMTGNPEKNYSGVLSTAGGVVFFGESSGAIAAADAASGKYLWHFETNQILKGSPMTYQTGARQYIAIAAGTNILSFALPEK